MQPRKRNLRSFNNGACIQSIILLGFIILLLWLDITKQLPLYINPKFIVLTQISYLLLVPMLVIQIIDTLLPTSSVYEQYCHKHSSIGKYTPFFMILLLAFAVPENTLNANLVSSKGLNSQSSAITHSIKDLPRPLAPVFGQMDTIKVTNLNYTEAMCEINNFPNEYAGKKITMTGFVFQIPGLANDQISLVRYVVMCCTADSLPYGVMCEGIEIQKYPDGTWLSIEGIIQMVTYDGKDAASIKITSLQKIEAPKDPYVYPYN
ncbi:TIGR03943 family putative permease subunit [Pelosinus baikalensis]|uniref:TIGR03943 family protein n=1 Tax=Pelosinus baikalensis TaxID=2892015 RepID=A0ABS8HVD2_9FIRM|nr:TIGR03943 family protein [Pelosinus baikalensis]MCC5465894.1 TIGR03943 family protein [Pelosinus baikalensis]